MTKKSIILCADDYGISDGINRAIETLAQDKRLSAVSCMTSSAYFPENPHILKALHPHLAIGLHITLTYLPPLTSGLSVMTENRLLLETWSRRIDRHALQSEIAAQFENFIAAFGFAPDFIDGHQHIHILPVIRDVVLQCRQKFAPSCWVRNACNPQITANKKRWIMTALGWRFRTMLRQKNIPHNDEIYGFYDYTVPQNFSDLFRTWISTASDSALIYVHPGFPDSALAQVDTVLAPRQNEYDFFASPAFTDMLDRDITLITQLLQS